MGDKWQNKDSMLFLNQLRGNTLINLKYNTTPRSITHLLFEHGLDIEPHLGLISCKM